MTEQEKKHITSVVWSASSRVAETLARRLGAEFLLMPCPRVPFLRRAGQYLRLAWLTRQRLDRSQPDLVLVQNPPVHAVAAVASWCRRHCASYVIDAHTGALMGSGRLGGWHRRRFQKLARTALFTVIHNEDLVPAAEELGLNYRVLEMAVPERPTDTRRELGHPAVTVICGYGRDEPIGELLAAARRLPEATFYLTGGNPGLNPGLVNVVLTGFLADSDYWQLLNGSDVVIALTTRENTILSGAYEGLAAEKPLVLSRTETLERAFPKGAVLVENRSESIAQGIRLALAQSAALIDKGKSLRQEKARSWERQSDALIRILAERNLVSGPAGPGS